MLAGVGPSVVTVLALAACGGHHGSSPDSGGDGPPGPAMTVTARELLRDVRSNDATHVPVTADQPMPGLAVQLLDDAGTASDVAVGSDGTFSFQAAPGAPYRLAVQSEIQLQPVEYLLDASALDLAPTLVGHYPRAIAPPGTTLTANVAAAPATGLAVIASIGLWTQIVRSTGTNGAFTVDWSQAGSVSGPMGLLDASAFDRAYWTNLDGVGSYYATTAACSEDFTMVAGTDNTLSCTAAAVPFDRCTHVVAHADAETMRLAAAAPTSYAAPFWRWVLFAVPAPALGPIGGLTLAYYTYTSGDLDLPVTFGNPFPGHDVSLAMQHFRSRTIALPGAAELTIYASTQHFVRPAGDCTTASETSGSIAIPTTPVLDGVTLADDGVELALDRTAQHVVTWDVASPGSTDYWAVRLYTVAAPANQTTLALARSWITEHHAVTIDPGVFVKGATYLIEIDAVTGYPGAAHGDFRTTSYPAATYAVSSIPSGTFVVTN